MPRETQRAVIFQPRGEKGKGRDLNGAHKCLIEDIERTKPDPYWRCSAMRQETGTRGSKYNLELGKVNFPFNLFIYYHEGGLEKSLGAECWARQPSEVPANLKYFMILWNLIEMLSLHYCTSCVATFNQTTKKNTPNIWDSKHIQKADKNKQTKNPPKRS